MYNIEDLCRDTCEVPRGQINTTVEYLSSHYRYTYYTIYFNKICTLGSRKSTTAHHRRYLSKYLVAIYFFLKTSSYLAF